MQICISLDSHLVPFDPVGTRRALKHKVLIVSIIKYICDKSFLSLFLEKSLKIFTAYCNLVNYLQALIQQHQKNN